MSDPAEAPRRFTWLISASVLTLKLSLGFALLWLAREELHGDPLWAYISLIVVSAEPASGSWKASVARFTNTLVGGAIGLAALWALPLSPVSVGLAVAVTVFAGSAFLGSPTSWKLAPVTTAIVMGQAILQNSREIGLESGSRRVLQVLVGSLLAVLISLAFDRLERGFRTAASRAH
jgi:uncharacterized membrane protein YccC